jgi:hypothetical protein
MNAETNGLSIHIISDSTQWIWIKFCNEEKFILILMSSILFHMQILSTLQYKVAKIDEVSFELRAKQGVCFTDKSQNLIRSPNFSACRPAPNFI